MKWSRALQLLSYRFGINDSLVSRLNRVIFMLPCQLNFLSFPDSRDAEINENFTRKLSKSERLQSGYRL